MSNIYRTSITIEASPEMVFDHFIDPERLVRWMGDFARLEAKAKGLFHVDINGVLIRGHYIAVERPTVIEIAWGEAGNDEMPPGTTTVRIELMAAPSGTLLTLEHRGLMGGEQAKHAMGWPYFLDRLKVLARVRTH